MKENVLKKLMAQRSDVIDRSELISSQEAAFPHEYRTNS